ncbi:MAG TPA: right-handed parallel beta-helix repeat-containing protein [Steroidobacteraceae bacterium]|nr:right-handed parallel beta-helix repeat-containing protein [Steroidobacteraceae bacterium]
MTPGTYTISENLVAQSSQTIEMAMGVIVQSAAGKNWKDSGLLDISSKQDVQVVGGGIDGNKANNKAGRAFGIRALSSQNITLDRVQIRDCAGSDPRGTNGGDGWTVYGASMRFQAFGVLSEGNVRNNASIVQVDGACVIGGFYDSSSGDNPGCGIDIEADESSQPIFDTAIIGVGMRGNHRALQIAHYSSGTEVMGCALRNSRAGDLLIASCDTVGFIGNHLKSQPTLPESNVVNVVNSSRIRFIGNDIAGSSRPNEAAGMFVQHNVKSIVISGCIFSGTKEYGLRIGHVAMPADVEEVIITDCIFLNCVDPALDLPVIYFEGNATAAKYPRRVVVRNNICVDQRAGGDAAAAFLKISTHIPDSVISEYDIGDNYIVGTTARYINCPNEGSFTATLTGCSSQPTGSIGYSRSGDGTVTLQMPAITGKSNSTAATITGMPAYLRPASPQTVFAVNHDDGTEKISRDIISTSGVITLHNALSASFSRSGTKGCGSCTVTYRRV